MSHACVLVAIDVVDPTNREEIEAAVDFQMAPYDENGEFFADGSRWDWYQIGGRFTGLLNPDYDAAQDPRNWESCTTCGGTGTRPGGLKEFGEAWFAGCNGCNGCQGTGKSRKFRNAPVPFDVAQVKTIDKSKIGAAYAFLRNRHWHEAERMGWFAMPTKSECEIKAEAAGGDPNVLTRRCVTTGDEHSKIVVWNEPQEIWDEQFQRRFLDPLPPDAVLVVVDYHV
jgi:hypothetical protein